MQKINSKSKKCYKSNQPSARINDCSNAAKYIKVIKYLQPQEGSFFSIGARGYKNTGNTNRKAQYRSE